MKSAKSLNISKVLNQFYSYSNFEIRRKAIYNRENYNLNNIKKLLTFLNNPQNSFKIYHVAGTKGKGLTTYYLSLFLHECFQVKTGTTFSPHVIDERDRFAINNTKPSWEAIIPFFEKVLKTVEENDLLVTVFDMFTAIAFLYFQANNIDVAIIETGLGGRFDSTNIVEPIMAIITQIDFDHTDKLGNTLKAITYEKAGIIKYQKPICYLFQDQEVNEVIENQAKLLKSSIVSVKEIHPFLRNINKKVKNKSSLFQALSCLPKAFKINASIALKVLEETGYLVNKDLEEMIQATFLKTNLLGRYEKKGSNCLLDGAHTPLSIRSLINEVNKICHQISYKKVNVCFYSFFDKEIEKIIQEIPLKWNLIFYHLNLHFVSNHLVEDVKYRIKLVRKNFKVIFHWQELNINEKKEELFLFTGSFKLVGFLLNEWKDLKEFQ